MIDKLKSFLPAIVDMLPQTDRWDSLIVNKRKPHTYRVFTQVDDIRICLHRFEPCGPEDCFEHPHPWPGAFLMLRGEYIHRVGYSPDLESDPDFLLTEIVRPYSMYEITNKQTWHSVQPTQETYTLMVNGPPWDGHTKTRTTKGKDLDSLDRMELEQHLKKFGHLIDNYRKYCEANDLSWF